MSEVKIEEGHVGNLTESQATALNEMKTIFVEEIKLSQAKIPAKSEAKSDQPRIDYFELSDYTLLRYLRARNFDVSRASRMLKKTLAWREKHRIGKLLSTPDNLLKTSERYVLYI